MVNLPLEKQHERWQRWARHQQLHPLLLTEANTATDVALAERLAATNVALTCKMNAKGQNY